MKVQIKGFIAINTSMSRGSKSEFSFFSCDMSKYGHVTVMPHTLEVDLPDDFDPREQQIQILKDKKAQAMADFQALVTTIDRQISELTAIEFEESGV